MPKSYLQVSEYYPTCINGSLTVYIAGTTELATAFNPISGAEISNPIPIGSDGYVQAYNVLNGVYYDVFAKDASGAVRFERQNISVFVGSTVGLLLGETSTTAYRGDRGKIAYDHSQAAHAPANADNTQATLNAGASNTTPVNADALAMLDSAAGNAIKKLTWANVKATLKTYFDGVYSTLTLGETSATAYRGDRGKIAYDHSQTTGNPHGATAADVGAASALHGDQHGYGESDPVSIDTRQISNMTAFARTLVDDATAADARATLGAAPVDTTLSNNPGSTTPPTTVSGSLVSKVQSLRDNVVSLFASVASRVPVITIANQSGGWHQIGYIDLPTNAYGRVYGWMTIVGRGVSAQLQFYIERDPSANKITSQFLSFSGGQLLPQMSWEVLGDGATIRVRWYVYLDANHSALVSYTGSSSYGYVASLTESVFVGASLPTGVNYIGNIAVQGSVRSYSLDKSGGSDNTPLTGNVQTQLNGKVGKTGDETIAGSKTFSSIPVVPNIDPESVGGAAANADFVANKVYPTWGGAFITATGSITLEHGCMRVVNANFLTVTLTNTPALGTVSWLYYAPVSCGGSLTLSFSDPIGVSRTHSKTATPGASHLPHWIKCTRCLSGWAIEWEAEA